MMSTRRAPRLAPAVDGAVVEVIHALPAVIVHSSVSVVAARRVRYTGPTRPARSNLQNLRPHRVKRRQAVKTIMFSQNDKEYLHGGAQASTAWFQRAPPALSGPATPRSGARAPRARSVRHSIPGESPGR